MYTDAEVKQSTDLEPETIPTTTHIVKSRPNLPSIPSLNWATTRFWSLVTAGVLSVAAYDPNPIPDWSSSWQQ